MSGVNSYPQRRSSGYAQRRRGGRRFATNINGLPANVLRWDGSYLVAAGNGDAFGGHPRMFAVMPTAICGGGRQQSCSSVDPTVRAFAAHTTSCAGNGRDGCLSAMRHQTLAGPGDRGPRRLPSSVGQLLTLVPSGSSFLARWGHLPGDSARPYGPVATCCGGARWNSSRRARPTALSSGSRRARHAASRPRPRIRSGRFRRAGVPHYRCIRSRAPPVRLPAPRRSNRDPVPVCAKRRRAPRNWRSPNTPTLCRRRRCRTPVLQWSERGRSHQPGLSSTNARRGLHRRQATILTLARGHPAVRGSGRTLRLRARAPSRQRIAEAVARCVERPPDREQVLRRARVAAASALGRSAQLASPARVASARAPFSAEQSPDLRSALRR